MNLHQRTENTKFFTQIISITSEGGTYIWPDAKEKFTISNGKIIGSKQGIRKIKEITLPNFSNNLVVK